MSSAAQNPLAGLTRTPFIGKDGLVSWQWLQFFNKLALLSGVPTFITNTHANRANISAVNYASGSLYYESDRAVAYIAVSGTWFYFAGVLPTLQASLPTDLGTSDINFLAFVTDYAHQLIWTGTGWTWAPGEQGSDFVLPFVSGPNPATGWQACNGSLNISRLNFDGSLAFVTVPNTPGSFYRQ